MAEQVKALSLTERSSKVRRAFYRMGYEEDYWFDEVVEVYDDYCIICVYYGEYYRAPYSIDAEGCVIPSVPDDWVKVEMEWVSANASPAATKAWERKINFGSAVKALGDGKVGGHLVLFGSPNELDLHGDYFDQETDFDIEDGMRSAVYYNHGFDPTLKRRKIGKAEIGLDNVGVWIEAQLDLRDEYEQAVYKLAEVGKLGWSSGTAAHLVEVEEVNKAVHIKRWPLGLDASMTPTPADPRQIIPLKQFIRDVRDISMLLSEAAPEAEPVSAASAVKAVDVPAVASRIEIEVKGDSTMTENQAPAADFVSKADFDAAMKASNDQLARLVELIENSVPLKKVGFYTEDSNDTSTRTKSMGDWLLAVKRGETKRLATVYKSFRQQYDPSEDGTKALSEDQGTTGGFLVPEEYLPRLVEMSAQASQIVAQVETIPVTTSTGRVPSLDMFTAPTAGVGNTALAGGVKAEIIAEGGAYNSVDPLFHLIEWRINKIGDYIKASEELMADNVLSLETLLARYIGIAIAAKKEYFILRGTGAGQPLGLLNADAAVSVSAASSNTFAYVDASNMISRFRAFTNKVYWLMHKSTIPDITKFEVGTGGAVWIANMAAGMQNMPLLGYPILFSEHLPKADNAGHALLVDLGAYALFSRGSLSIAYSEHADFLNGNGVWRFEERLDGKPWLKDKITDANPQGSYTESPYVYFNN